MIRHIDMRGAVLGAALAAICALPSSAQGPTGTFAFGGWTSFLANGLSTSVVTISSSPRVLALVDCYNPNASPVYIQIFNAASGSVTLGATTPTLSVPIGAGNTGGFAMQTSGIAFSTAISVAATTTARGATAPPAAPDCNFAYN